MKLSDAVKVYSGSTEAVKVILGSAEVWLNITPWDGYIRLSVPAGPTVGTPVLSKIEETPVVIEADDVDTLNIPAVPLVSVNTSVS